MIRADDLLAPLLKNLSIEEGVRLARIKKSWHTIFDKPLSLHMSPVKLSEGELLLNVDSPIWLHQLSYYKKEITGKLSAFGIKDIRFRLGRIPPKKNRVSDGQDTVTLSSQESLFISHVVMNVRNEELKTAIKKAIEKSLKTSKLR